MEVEGILLQATKNTLHKDIGSDLQNMSGKSKDFHCGRHVIELLDVYVNVFKQS